MRLLAAVPAFVFATCATQPPRSACDTGALGAATDGASLAEACSAMPAPMKEWARSGSAAPSDPMVFSGLCELDLSSIDDTIAGRLRLYDGCALTDLGDRDAFALAGGSPLLAGATYAWMRRANVSGDIAGAARKLMTPGASAIPLSEMPVVANGTANPGSADLWVDATGVHDASGTKATFPARAGDAFQGWSIPGVEGGTTIAVAKSVTVDTLKRVAASVAKPGETVTVLAVKGNGDVAEALVGVPLKVTDAFASEGVDGDASVADLLTKGVQTLSMSERPCIDAPGGLACVSGGPDGVKDRAISTFYIDPKPVSGADYAACVDAGFCAKTSAKGADAVSVPFEAAWQYCGWVGKRLPTELEWERAARQEKVALSGGPEWTSTWYSATAPQSGRDPQGVCAASPRCKESKKKTVRSSIDIRAARTLGSSAALRCAQSDPWLTNFPPHFVAEPRPVRSLPAAPAAAELAIARIDEDTFAAKPVCTEDQLPAWTPKGMKGGVSTTFCRDPFSYIKTNEARRHLFGKYIRDIGGGYIGVGSDQAYDFIAVAKSEWAWPMDYDPNVVRIHYVDRAFIAVSDTPKAFVERFEEKNLDESLGIIAKAEPERAKELQAFFKAYRKRLHKHYRESLEPLEDPNFGWLAVPEHYTYIKDMYAMGRIVPIGGDMLGSKSMKNVGEAARKLGIPISVYYPSNAPLAWGGIMTKEYRANIAGLPFDEDSLVIATYNTGAYGQKGYWHYNTQRAQMYQARLQHAGFNHVRTLWWDRIPADDPDATVLGLRASLTP